MQRVNWIVIVVDMATQFEDLVVRDGLGFIRRLYTARFILHFDLEEVTDDIFTIVGAFERLSPRSQDRCKAFICVLLLVMSMFILVVKDGVGLAEG